MELVHAVRAPQIDSWHISPQIKHDFFLCENHSTQMLLARKQQHRVMKPWCAYYSICFTPWDQSTLMFCANVMQCNSDITKNYINK